MLQLEIRCRDAEEIRTSRDSMTQELESQVQEFTLKVRAEEVKYAELYVSTKSLRQAND